MIWGENPLFSETSIYALQKKKSPKKSHKRNKKTHPTCYQVYLPRFFSMEVGKKLLKKFSNPKKCQVQLLKWHILTFWALRARFQTRTCPKKPGRLRRDGQIHRPPVRCRYVMGNYHWLHLRKTNLNFLTKKKGFNNLLRFLILAIVLRFLKGSYTTSGAFLLFLFDAEADEPN